MDDESIVPIFTGGSKLGIFGIPMIVPESSGTTEAFVAYFLSPRILVQSPCNRGQGYFVGDSLKTQRCRFELRLNLTGEQVWRVQFLMVYCMSLQDC